MALFRNEPIELQEVVINKKTNVSIRKILNHIQDDLKDNPQFKYHMIPDYYNIINKLLMETDTLHYLKGLIKNESGFMNHIDKNFHAVKKLKEASNSLTSVHYINRKEITFRTDWSYGEWHIDFLDTPYFLNTDLQSVFN